MGRSQFIPSMYHRRLLLLAVIWLGGLGALSGKLYSLTVVDGAELRVEAFRHLVNERLIPTTRGRILDRSGRVLATDAPSYELRVDYRVISEAWAYQRAASEARSDHREVWAGLTRAQRDRLIERDYLPQFADQVEQLWSEISTVTGLPRDVIDERKNRIVAAVHRTKSVVTRRALERARAEARERELATEPSLGDVAMPIREEQEAHTVLSNLDDASAFELRRLVDGEGALVDRRGRPLVQIVDSGSRHYPLDRMQVALDRSHLPSPIREGGHVAIAVRGVAWHLLGSMRDRIQAEDIERNPPRFREGPERGRLNLRGYRDGDSVGHRGMEAYYEEHLRGAKGLVTYHRDTGEETRIEPVPGRDLQLTLDIELQARMQAIMDPQFGLLVAQPWHRGAGFQTEEFQNPLVPDGTPLSGAAVVIDIATADILAMVTAPGVDRADFAVDQGEYVHDDLYRPLADRAIGMPLPPGSIAKPLVYCMGVTEGVWPLDAKVECHGHLLPNRRDVYRCWIYRPRYGFQTHFQKYGEGLDAPLAIAESCNIYFYNVARELGPKRIAKWYRRFGVGRAIVHGLPEEAQYPGLIGYADPTEPIQLHDAIHMGIGQGPVNWTPLHAANAHATLARGGLWMPPRIIMTAELLQDYQTHRLNLNADAVANALEGMRQSANESYGSSHHLTIQNVGREPIMNVPGVTVRAKTGTAQAPKLVRRNEETGELETLRDGDHSWYVCTVALEGDVQPRYAIAVFVEYGGSGGRVAGPIANQIVWQLRELGYL
jgi:penicillin-binding protein 2